MKKIICLIVFVYSGVYSLIGQTSEPIVRIAGDSIVTNAKFLNPLFWDYQNASFSLYKSFDVPIGNDTYQVNLSDYDVARGDGGFFRIIDIIKDNKIILRVPQSDGWDSLCTKEMQDDVSNKYFMTIHLSATSVALVFVGYFYNSEPPLLTIVIIHNGKAKMVFNKPFIVKEIREIEGKTYFLLYDRFFEYVSGDEPVNEAVMYGIWNENGVLYFGGPYGTTKQ
ncbi:hypothetical protein [Gabonibacter chumensis]|uniref:hypothetical protein n=1 Tax=Gabonibacter chumensis TaxID=2972474 RepID=UPI00257255CB|nr:hypothetical protein [Gabonibacter chumensis]MCR9011630.1 hypothetical protein [Gabonibacter chumensis]